jgi:hypothetical protein
VHLAVSNRDVFSKGFSEMPNRRHDFGNYVLDLTPDNERDRIADQLKERHLARDAVVYTEAAAISEVQFPITCVLSAIALMRDGTTVEIGAVGREGLAGVQLALGVRRVPGEMRCQVEGNAFSMEARAFCASLETLPQFRAIVLRYTQSFINAISQSIACNSVHAVTQRCARWLLMTRDRVGREDFYLTQEFLAYMLGVRRSGVSMAAGTLQDAGLIRYRRGNIEILDAVRLESVSCECYRTIKDAYEELMGIRRS